MTQIAFSDKVVTYETFVSDVATRVAAALMRAKNLPSYISQRKAFEMYGKANVLRWTEKRMIEPRRTPGRLEYEVARLDELQCRIQDYL